MDRARCKMLQAGRNRNRRHQSPPRPAAPCASHPTPGLHISGPVLTAHAGAPQPGCVSPPVPFALHRLADMRPSSPARNRVTSTAIRLLCRLSHLSHRRRTRQRPLRYSLNHRNRRFVLPVLRGLRHGPLPAGLPPHHGGGLRADPRPLLPGRPGQGPPTRRRLIPGPHTRPPFPGRLCDQHVTTCGNCRKWRSDVQRTRSCWTAREAIQRSFVGMGVPLSRSWRNSCA